MQSKLFYFMVTWLIFTGLSGSVAAATQYQVVKVESWDTLNMRAGAGVKSAIVQKLPYNATGIVRTGNAQAVGKTNWVEIRWQDKSGWVSDAYLSAQVQAAPVDGTGKADAAKESPATAVAVVTDKAKVEQISAEVSPVTGSKTVAKKKQSGMWILECGSSSPYWKVEVLPEWMTGTLGNHVTGMPILNKRQLHGKYNKVAVETELRGANKWNRLRMTLTYTKSCYSSLAKRKLAFSVEGTFNDKEISGCCRSYQVK